MHRSEYKPKVKRRTAIINESMETRSMHLSRDGGLLLYVVEGSSTSKVKQGSKYQQFNWRRQFVVRFCITPTSKTCIVLYPLQEFQIIGIRYSKPHPKLCSHGRVLQQEIIIYIHTSPLALSGFHDLQFWIHRVFVSINTSWRPPERPFVSSNLTM